MNEIEPSKSWFCQNWKENDCFPRKVEEKSQQKYGTFFLNIGIFLGIWLSHQIGIFMCGNIRNTNNRCGVNNLYWVLTAHCTYLYVKTEGRRELSPLNPWLPCVSSCENFPPAPKVALIKDFWDHSTPCQQAKVSPRSWPRPNLMYGFT